ncbi:hypothetical protein BLNAU_13026 [Blattamonas nauphoetae]|uniref:TmcB/TmcC TPR repeats domain-containing protein n=1 Tax=Blattamonas nauphoetae TaxID=2049346 RepID=A0ABQ9XMK5_9EUKA|nr:hypothetical protein BLNAU_13026 [Blattamonas nauphoetae]
MSAKGNAFYSACTGFVVVLDISFLVSTFIGPYDSNKPFLPFVIVIPFLLVAIAAAFGLYFLSNFISRRYYVMGPKDSIPILPSKHFPEQTTSYLRNSQMDDTRYLLSPSSQSVSNHKMQTVLSPPPIPFTSSSVPILLPVSQLQSPTEKAPAGNPDFPSSPIVIRMPSQTQSVPHSPNTAASTSNLQSGFHSSDISEIDEAHKPTSLSEIVPTPRDHTRNTTEVMSSRRNSAVVVSSPRPHPNQASTDHLPKLVRGLSSQLQSAPFSARSLSQLQNPTPTNQLSALIISEQLRPSKPVPKYTRFFQFERAIRFIQLPEFRQEHSHHVFCEKMMALGTKKFANSSAMWTTAALYYSSIFENKSKAADALQKSKQCVPNIIERWTEFRFMRDMEQTKMQEGGQSTSVLFRLEMDKATREHEQSKAYFKQIWFLLSKDNIDMDRVNVFLNKGISAYWKANVVYLALLEAYPNSTQVIRGHGSLIRDIERDDDLAMSMFNHANALEDTSYSTSSESESMGSKLSEGGSRLGNRAMFHTKNKRRRRKKKGIRGSQFIMSEVKKKNPARKLLIVLISYSIIIAVGMAMMFIIAFITYQSCVSYSSDIQHIAEIQMVCTRGLRTLKNWEIQHTQWVIDDPDLMASLMYIPPETVQRENLRIYARDLGEDLLFTYNSLSEAEKDYFEGSKPNFFALNTDSTGAITKIWEHPMSVMDVVNSVYNSLFYVADFGSISDLMSINQANYVYTNVPVVAMEELKFMTGEFSHFSKRSVDVSVIVSIVICAFIIMYTFFPTSFTFILYARKFTKQRKEALFKFVTAPKQTYIKLKTRLDGTDPDQNSATDAMSTIDPVSTVDLVDTIGFDHSEIVLDAPKNRYQVNSGRDGTISSGRRVSHHAMIPSKFGTGSVSIIDELDSFNSNKASTVAESSNRSEEEKNPPTEQAQSEVDNLDSVEKIRQRRKEKKDRKGSLYSSLNLDPLPPLPDSAVPQNVFQRPYSTIHSPSIFTPPSFSPLEPFPDSLTGAAQMPNQAQTTIFNEPEKQEGQPEVAEEEEGEEEDEYINDLREKVHKLHNVNPPALKCMLSTTLIISWICIVTVALTAILSVQTIGLNRDQLFFSSYRESIVNVIVFNAIQIPFPSLPVPEQFTYAKSTRPGWKDLSHINNNAEVLQQNMDDLLQYFVTIHRKLKEGADEKDPSYLSGDEEIDARSVPRTLKPKSDMLVIALNQTKCLLYNESLCTPGRMYDIENEFLGLESLISDFVMAARSIIQVPNAGAAITLNDSNIMKLMSMVRFDLADGISKYTNALTIDQEALMLQYRNILVVISIVCYLLILAITSCLLFPAYYMLRRTSMVTDMIVSIDPRLDQMLNVITWNDDRGSGIARFDYQHKEVCDSAVALVTGMEKDTWTKMRRRLCADLVTKIFATVDDEEQMMRKYRINHKHVSKHESEHSSIVTKLLTSIIHILHDAPGAQTNLIQILSMWLLQHTSFFDRSMVSALEDKIAKSEVMEEIDMGKFVIPPSLAAYLESDKCSMARQGQINSLFSGLRLGV